MEEVAPPTYVQLLDHPFQHDPIGKVTVRLQADIVSGVRQMTASLQPNRQSSWLDAWKAAATVAEDKLGESLKAEDQISEALIASLVSRLVPSESALWAASSMPIRDLDMFYSPQGPSVPVGCNRGASGIDGTIASAAGYSLGLGRHVTVLIGDLAMLHDLNSLAILKNEDVRVILVVINNNGGGIFGHLPIAEYGATFEKYFVTPHGLEFARAAEMFSIPYTKAATVSELLSAYQRDCQERRVSIIEVVVDRETNQRLHSEVVRSIATEVDGL
jgi:2-succinyl-5-enolpyruvyl-6-hydroxy-3-cyclohexene-1-carboxylate synthase